MHLLGYNLSVAVGVEFITLAGAAFEIDVVMLVHPKLIYLNKIGILTKQETPGVTIGEIRDSFIKVYCLARDLLCWEVMIC